MKAKNAWKPPHMDDIAKLINIKKKRKDHSGEISISKTAAGYDMNANPIPLLTTYIWNGFKV